MNCRACSDFESNRKTGSVNAKCKSCAAREIANGQDFYNSRTRKTRTAGYMRLLEKLFGKEGIEAGHMEVRRISGLIRGEVV